MKGLDRYKPLSELDSRVGDSTLFCTYDSPDYRSISDHATEINWLHTVDMLTDANRKALAAGWQVWNADDTRLIIAYRPDVFDGATFDPACMPTIYLTRGRRTKRPEGSRNLPPDAPWTVTLFLEPDVTTSPEFYPDRKAAVAGALELAQRFTAGDVDYRSLYQVPRTEYFLKLDQMTGRTQ
jgi:hypothetical protein